jgi:Ser/Thr protein kinase RdoA (MazF antagonist)
MRSQSLERTNASAASDLFQVIRSILSPRALLAEVARRYALVPTTCRLLKRGLNDTYHVTAVDGQYILRVYRAEWRSASAIEYELELLCHLASRGVSVAVPLRTKEDQLVWSVSAPEGMRHVVLFSYAHGTRVSWTSEDDANLIGRVAAAIHTASDDFVSEHSRPPIDLAYLIEAPLVAIRPFLAHRPDDLAFLEQFAGRLKARGDELDALDWGVCHGDFGPKNIHVATDRSLTVFDFDLCGPGWRAYDLALIQWVATDHQTDGLWEAFLRGYASVRPLSADDVNAIPFFHAAAHVASLGLFAENVGDWGSADMSDWLFDRELKFFRRWADEHMPAALGKDL